MIYLKLQRDDGTIVGVEKHENPNYVCYQERNNLIIVCQEKDAQGIMSKNGAAIYQLNDKPLLRGTEETLLSAFIIDKYEYEMLENQFKDVPAEEESETSDENISKTLTMAELTAEVEKLKAQIAAFPSSTVNDEATVKFYTTLSEPTTNSIAKIRAAAQSYLDETEQKEEA